MAAQPPTRIVVVGMMGSGKTTVGREIARRTGWPWLDNDFSCRVTAVPIFGSNNDVFLQQQR